MMRLLGVPVLLALCGCGASPHGPARPFEAEQAPAGLHFSVEPTLAAAGGVSELSLSNGAATPIGYNLCIAALEHLDGGLWGPARSYAVSCPQSFQTLGPGQTATGQAVLPVTIEPGVYRFVTQLGASSENLPDVQLRSQPFRVPAD